MSVVAGVDSSTQSCTVELRDGSTGALLSRASVGHPPTTPPVSEQDPHDWWNALGSALTAACEQAGITTRDVAAIAVGAQCHGLVMMDSTGEVVRPTKLWNDTTSAPHAAMLLAERPAAKWAGGIGLVPSAALTIAKLRWMAECEPASLERTAHVCVPHDYLTWRLTGDRVTDRSDASGTGYYGLDDAWNTDLLAAHVDSQLDWKAMLPRVLGPEEQAGVVTAAAAAELGLSDSVVVGPGGGDQHLGAVGLGAGVGDVLVSLGTSGVVMAPSLESVVDTQGWIDSVADAAGGYLPLVCTLNSTKVTDAFARLLGVPIAELDDMALRADPSKAPTLLAYLDGERSPRRPDASGLMSGIRSDTTREDMALAAFRGVVDGLTRAWIAMQSAGIRHTGSLVVTGGGAKSHTYLQLIADAFGAPVEVRDASDATARGAAIQAAAVLAGERIGVIRDAWKPAQTTMVEPRHSTPQPPSEEYGVLAELEDERVDKMLARSREA